MEVATATKSSQQNRAIRHLIALAKRAAELNAELQSEHVVGTPKWHAHESIDDKLHDMLTALGD